MASGNANRVRGSLRVELERPCRPRRRADRAEHGGRPPTVDARAEHAAERILHLATGNERSDQIFATDIFRFRGCQHGWKNHGRAMHNAGITRVVVVEGMRRRTVGERRAQGRGRDRGSDDMARPRRMGPGNVIAHAGRQPGLRSRQGDADDVDDAAQRGAPCGGRDGGKR